MGCSSVKVISDCNNSAFALFGAEERRVLNWSRSSDSVAATSPGVGTACGLLCGVDGLEVSIVESCAKNVDIEGRRPRVFVLGLILCSTGFTR